MHLPHAVQQCPSCYMYCLSRAPSAGGPPVPPHSHAVAGQGGPHLTQPRAVTLPHLHPCSHSHPNDLCGPRPRFRSLPHQQPPPKSNLPHSNMHPHLGPGGRIGPPPSHNIVGVPIDESPPPLPPHGPPSVPPAHLISRSSSSHNHDGVHSPITGSPHQFSSQDASSNYQGPLRALGHPYLAPQSHSSKAKTLPQESLPNKNAVPSEQTAIYQTIDEVLEEKSCISQRNDSSNSCSPQASQSNKDNHQSVYNQPKRLETHHGEDSKAKASQNLHTNSLPHRSANSSNQKINASQTLQKSHHTSNQKSSPTQSTTSAPVAKCDDKTVSKQSPTNEEARARSGNPPAPNQQTENSQTSKLNQTPSKNLSAPHPSGNPSFSNPRQSDPNPHSTSSRSHSSHTSQRPTQPLIDPNMGHSHSDMNYIHPNMSHSHPDMNYIHPPSHLNTSQSHPPPSHPPPSHPQDRIHPDQKHPNHPPHPPHTNPTLSHHPSHPNSSNSHSNLDSGYPHPSSHSNPAYPRPPHPNASYSHPPHPNPNLSQQHPPHLNSGHSHPPSHPNQNHSLSISNSSFSHPDSHLSSGYSHVQHPASHPRPPQPNPNHSYRPPHLNPNAQHAYAPPLHSTQGQSRPPLHLNAKLSHPPSQSNLNTTNPPHSNSDYSNPSHQNPSQCLPPHQNPSHSHPPHHNLGHSHLPPHYNSGHSHHTHQTQQGYSHPPSHPSTDYMHHSHHQNVKHVSQHSNSSHQPQPHSHSLHPSHQNSAHIAHQGSKKIQRQDSNPSLPPINDQPVQHPSLSHSSHPHPQGNSHGCPCGSSLYHPSQDVCAPCEVVHSLPHPPYCDATHRAAHQPKSSEPHMHHSMEIDKRHFDGYGIEGPRGELVPPPPPMPPPPMLPPDSFDQIRYACLPHQQLVPPPRLQEMVLGCPEHGHHHISSAAKVDRPYCGPGPPGRNRPLCGGPISKARSLDVPSLLNKSHHHVPVANGNHRHLVRRPQTVSQSAVMGGSRHGLSPRGVAVDDCGSRSDRWRRNGSQSAGQAYELSQDLADKRLEMLERRYGGERARRAATTIQRAYRHYAIHKKFRAITATAKAQEKRLSRRFTLESSEWGDGINGNGHPCDAEQRIRSEFDKLNRNLNASVYGVDSNRRPSRSLSMRDSRTSQNSRGEGDQLNDSSLYCHSPSGPTPSTPVINGELQQHLHQSSEANSYTSSREFKYFPSEDSGFGSQDPMGKQPSSSHRSKSAGRGNNNNNNKKVPPEVPRRSSSIKNEGGVDSFLYSSANHRVQVPPSLTPPSSHSSEMGSDRSALRRSADNGSLSSVQSSGSDSSLSQSTSDRTTPLSQDHHENPEFVTPTSPIWKRKTQMSHPELPYDDKRLSNISENSEDSCHSVSSEGLSYSQYPHGHPNSRHAHLPHQSSFNSSHEFKISEVLRKRQYRVGLNLFNKKSEKGVNYLIGRSFLENSPQAVAKFLLTRKGLSKQMIGEYLGNLQNPLNMSVLECFATEIDLSGMQVDVALRKFQTHFRMPGEAQKIERLMQVFAQRYCQCNRDIVAKLRDPETIFVLAFAIIMLNTDLHTASLKPEKRMKLEDFIKNLRGVDEGCDIEREMLEGMYHRIKSQEFRPGHDHVTQVMKVQQTIVGKKPVLALPHRRLVCYCRLYEIPDSNKKERVGLHQREVFLFNDLLVITKIFSKKKNSVTYTFRQSFPLSGLSVNTKEATHYSFLLEVKQRVDNKVLVTFNARNEHDRTKFCEDLRESILEMDEMENLRIEGELERQKANLRTSRPNSTAENRDSGVADMELITPGEKTCSLKPEGTLKRTTLSNSLLDIHEAGL